jgi:hypothetical protein
MRVLTSPIVGALPRRYAAIPARPANFPTIEEARLSATGGAFNNSAKVVTSSEIADINLLTAKWIFAAERVLDLAP